MARSSSWALWARDAARPHPTALAALLAGLAMAEAVEHRVADCASP